MPALVDDVEIQPDLDPSLSRDHAHHVLGIGQDRGLQTLVLFGLQQSLWNRGRATYRSNDRLAYHLLSMEYVVHYRLDLGTERRA